MKLTYQTGIATLIQFIALSALTLVSQVGSVVSTCRTDSSNCVSNLITSIILYILVAVVFGSIWLVGMAAQNLRNKWLAWLLICTEGLIALVALFSVKLSLHHHKSILSILAMLTSLGIAALAVWTITLAFRLMRSEGQRISGGSQRRRRRRPTGKTAA